MPCNRFPGTISFFRRLTRFQEILELCDGVSDTSTIIEASAENAHIVHDAQLAASLSASHLAESLAQLTTTTQDSLETFNASAIKLAQSLSPRGSLIDFVRLIEVVLPSNPFLFQRLYALTFVRSRPIDHRILASSPNFPSDLGGPEFSTPPASILVLCTNGESSANCLCLSFITYIRASGYFFFPSANILSNLHTINALLCK